MKKPLYKHLWFWLLLVVAITIVGGLASGQKGSNNAQQNSEDDVSSVEDASDTSDESEIITSTAEPESNSDTTSEVSDTPAEYRSALIKASSYANLMNMSKRGVYDQLVSENVPLKLPSMQLNTSKQIGTKMQLPRQKVIQILCTCQKPGYWIN